MSLGVLMKARRVCLAFLLLRIHSDTIYAKRLGPLTSILFRLDLVLMERAIQIESSKMANEFGSGTK
jgi:hypothetical protein